MTMKRADKKKKKSGKTMAETADRHELYQESVQEPTEDVIHFKRFFQFTW